MLLKESTLKILHSFSCKIISNQFFNDFTFSAVILDMMAMEGYVRKKLSFFFFLKDLVNNILQGLVDD